MSTSIVSYYKLNRLFENKIEPFDLSRIKKNKSSFTLADTLNTRYVQPNFTDLIGNFDESNQPKIILISAPGATGKSELTNNLSATLKIPVFDLAKHEPVASNSLTGLFYDTLGPIELGKFVEQLSNGTSSLIIDALDEGYLKTTVEGYNAFLDGIIDISRQSKNTPFILLGRTQVVEYTWLYLENNQLESTLLRIEPFTIDQAKEFLDKQIEEERYSQQYKQVRDYIIQSVEGFFRSTSEISKKDYQSFIGYAPVLLSITKLLREERNYKALYENLVSKNDKGIDLIISIVRFILLRDKEEKIEKLLLPTLFKGRDSNFITEVTKNAYSIEEQCVRILSYVSSKPIEFSVSHDISFDNQYEEKIGEWIKEHPFLENNRIQNAVFESYILAELMITGKYQNIIKEYLTTRYRDAYMLFFIFDNISRDRIIRSEYLPVIYSSIQSLDDTESFSCLDLMEKQNNCEESEQISCELVFSIASTEKEYTFELILEKDKYLEIGNMISNFNLNAPINVILDSNRCELKSPVSLICKNIHINATELVIKQGGDTENVVHLECEKFVIDYSNGKIPSLLKHHTESLKFNIFSSNRPEFPFGDYFRSNDETSKLDNQQREKYLKLRKIMLLFRSHSKGVKARYKDKIEHKRVLGNDIGPKVLDSLIEKGVLTSDVIFYYINDDQFHNHLGITYNDLKNKTLNQKTIDFLNEIK